MKYELNDKVVIFGSHVEIDGEVAECDICGGAATQLIHEGEYATPVCSRHPEDLVGKWILGAKYPDDR